MSTTDVLTELIADLSRNVESMGVVVEAAVEWWESRMSDGEDSLDMCGMPILGQRVYESTKRLEAAVKAYKQRGTK